MKIKDLKAHELAFLKEKINILDAYCDMVIALIHFDELDIGDLLSVLSDYGSIINECYLRLRHKKEKCDNETCERETKTDI